MKVFSISGKAQNGKDTFALFAKEILENKGYKVLITHYADLVKYTCKTFFDWNGEKDMAGRSLLQRVGTDDIRNKYPNFWVEYIAKILSIFQSEWDCVLIPDTRFPNEIEELLKFGLDVETIRINRPNFDNGLTEEQKNHSSETSLDNYGFNFFIDNIGNLDDFKNTTIDFFKRYRVW